jgi:CHAD domain-containing protein
LASQLQNALEDTSGGTQRDAFALHPEAASKAERGYRLFAATPLEARRASPVTLDAGISSLVAFRTIALACVAHLQENEQGVRESDDPEFVHQARVAIRRLRSALRLWKPQLPEAFVATYDAQWRALALILGDARNWDVFLSEMLPELASSFPERSEIGALSRYATRQRESRRKRVRAALKNVAYSRLLLEFTAAVLKLAESAASAVPLKVFAVHCLNKRAKKVIQQASATAKDAASRHRCRVALKRLRYALEFFDSLLPQKHLESYHQAVTQLQDLLGQMNDLDVAVQLIEEALPAQPADEIHAWMSQRNDLLLHKLDKSLNAFLRQKLPWKDR